MPELPEVETTVRGIAPHIQNEVVSDVVVRESRLRWPVPDSLAQMLVGKTIKGVNRRAKYILIEIEHGYVLLHLGMSGSLRLTRLNALPKTHDHVEIEISGKFLLRFHDPRRFGCVLWIDSDPYKHPLLASLGPEPFDRDFNGTYLYDKAQTRKSAVKNLIMDSHIVVGVGNIYASESLFRSGIRPQRHANRIAVVRYEKLVDTIRATLEDAIAAGGTTLRDYVNGTGTPGYFSLDLGVYERRGEPCKVCGNPIKSLIIGQRSTYYCGHCQT